LHGRGYNRSLKKSDTSNLIKDTAKAAVLGAGIGAITPIIPVAPIIYKAYNLAKIGKSLYENYEKSKNKEKTFDEIFRESTKYSASEGVVKLSEKEASKIAKSIVINSAGLISQISKETKVNEEVYASMLEGSVKNAIVSGIGNFTSYTIEGLMA
jgi:hypothetical protein